MKHTNIQEALAVVLDLATQNVIDDSELQEEAARQEAACELVAEFLDSVASLNAEVDSSNGIAVLMTALCNAVPNRMTLESSDNDHDSGEIYVDSPSSGQRFVIKVSEIC